jgi:hypothetical protein
MRDKNAPAFQESRGNENLAAKPINSTTQVASRQKSKGRVKKLLLRGASALTAIAILAQVTYTYSGSNQWENLGERNGVTLYSMKAPGANLRTFKTVWKVRSTLSKFVMFAQDETLDIGNYDIRAFEKDEKIHVLYSAWKNRFPWPLKPREFVIRNEFSQDPKTKALLYKVIAAPQKVPADGCCVRVAVMNNSWRLTPLRSGEIEVEWILDMDIGLPYLMANPMLTDVAYWFAPKVQKYLDLERYQNAKYDWIEEAQP